MNHKKLYVIEQRDTCVAVRKVTHIADNGAALYEDIAVLSPEKAHDIAERMSTTAEEIIDEQQQSLSEVKTE